MTMVSNLVHFSNATLAGCLKFVDDYHKGARRQDFIHMLNVEERWLYDSTAWHTADFHEKFYKVLAECFPETKNVAYLGTKYLYTQKKFQTFTSMIGLLVKPRLIFSMLPKAATRMNLYNRYEFAMLREHVAVQSGQLIQRYLEADRHALNESLCDAARGSIDGIFEKLGHKIVAFEEKTCVKTGSDHCTYVVTWINRRFIVNLLACATLFAGLFYLGVSVPGLSFTQSLSGSLLFSVLVYVAWQFYTARTNMKAAFEFQQRVLEQQREMFVHNLELNKKLLSYQKELAEALQMATAGDSYLGLLHDMGSPLSVLSFCSEELAKVQTGENAYSLEKLTGKVAAATVRLTRQRNMIRVMNKAHTSEHVVDVNVMSVIREVVEFFETIFHNQNIHVEIQSLLKDEDTISSVEGCFEAVVLNLVQNALNALSLTQKRFLRLFAKYLPNGDIEVRISDTGPGIPAERRGSLFKRFGSSAGGTGLGLYRTKQMVEKMKGQIECLTGEGGTTFIVTVPKKMVLERHTGY